MLRYRSSLRKNARNVTHNNKNRQTAAAFGLAASGGCFYFGAMKKTISAIISIFSFLAILGTLTLCKAEKGPEEIIGAVKKLELSYKGYTLGQRLDSTKLKALKKSPEKDSYPGTIKMIDNGLIIVIDKKNQIIVAVSKRVKGAASNELKALVNELMLLFGEPTAVAHEKIIYWAYGKNGKITDEAYNKAKDTGKLEVLATVKLNSSKRIFKVTSDKKEKADVYVIMSSEPLISALLKH